MANVLSADFSRFLADLSNRLSPTDKMELIAAVDDIKDGDTEALIHTVDDPRVPSKAKMAINSLLQSYAA